MTLKEYILTTKGINDYGLYDTNTHKLLSFFAKASPLEILTYQDYPIDYVTVNVFTYPDDSKAIRACVYLCAESQAESGDMEELKQDLEKISEGQE